MEPQKSDKKAKVGQDGLTKQQRYVARHRPQVNAKNAERIREKRALAKLEADTKNHIALTETSTGNSSMVPQIMDAQSQPVVEGSPADSAPDHSAEYYTSTEYYNSVEFDQQLDADLAALDKLDHEILVSELHDDYRTLRSHIEEALSIICPGQWDFHAGWHCGRPFPGSNSQRCISFYTKQCRELLNKLRALLRQIPVEQEVWEVTLDMIEWISGAWSFLFQLHDCLTRVNSADGSRILAQDSEDLSTSSDGFKDE